MKVENLEDLYELSPMQQGMLFHSLYAPASGVYFVQLSCTFPLALNVWAFERAWQYLIDRHPVLRTFFVWEGLKEPVQVVQRWVKLPLEQHDWSQLNPSEQQKRLEAFLQADRRDGFELSQAPLMRLTLIRIADDTYHFVWSYHHLLLDGWSQPLLLKEVFALYEAFCQGQIVHLEKPRPYRDYIEWLQQQNQSRAEVFWRQALEGFTTPTLPLVDRQPVGLSGQPENDGELQIQLSLATTTGLESLARRHRLTLNSMVQGAWALLLSHYSGENDVVFGVTVSGRPEVLTGIESMVGLFINTLPMRVRVVPEKPLLSWLKEIQDWQVELRQYEYSPLVQVQGWSELPRGTSLFESILVFENYPVDDALREQSAKLKIRDVRFIERTHYPLALMAVPGPRASLQIQFDQQHFEPATISRMAGHLQTLLEGIVANPEQRLWDLPLLTEAERQQLLVDWNATQADYPRESCLHQLFEAQVERTPEAVALVFEAEQLSYRELNQRANQLAHHLRALGVGPEVLVGLCMERSPEMVIGLLGILKAGGAYVPLDPTYPPERLAFMLEDAQVPVLLTQQHLLRWLPKHAKHAAHLVCLDRDRDAVAQLSAANPLSGVRAENLAYVIYTSGSTGRPKGVLGTHRAAINRFHWMWKTYPFEPEEICCQKTSLSFVDSVWEIFGPLLQGIRTVIIPDIVVKSPQQMLQTLSAHSVTRIVLVPSLLRVLLEASADLRDQLPRLKYWVSSGEALPLELALSFLDSMPCSTLINLYGSSEVAADATCYDTTNNKSLTCIPIGRPIANIQIYLLDRHLQLVPIGVPGELHVGGEGLARGYLRRPELTAERFIPNPFSGEQGARLYKTGDLARYRPDGNLEFLGRLDHQVKIRGFRVELGEIEAVLRQHPAVRQAVVIAREYVHGDKHLVAYVVPHEKQSATVGDLHRHAQKHLPAYMVPAFVLLETLPQTPNGKIDRRALPAPDSPRATAKDSYVAPATLMQYQLLQIWEELLDVRPIGIRDNFFELGGHSLLAARLMHRIEQVCGKKLPLATLFAGATVEHLSNALLEEVDTSSRALVVAVQASGSKRPFFYLHGDWSAGAFYCLKLAHHLGQDQPFYVLEPYHFEGLAVPPPFEAMAAAHLEALRSVQPVGPYLLGGFCNGGLIASELARQLQAQGERVDLLLLIDPAAPASHHWLRSLLGHLGALLHLSPQQQFAWFLHLRHVYKYLRLVQYRQRWHDLVGDVGIPRRRASAGLGRGRLAWVVPSVEAMRRNWLNIYEWVAADYQPDPYPGKLTVFWSSEGAASEQRGGWRHLLRRVRGSRPLEANEVEAQLIPGTHQSWRIEHHRTLADHLERCLSQAHAAALRQ